MATLQELLTEAQAAYHSLQIGKAVAMARDMNGEEVRYTQANRADLKLYIGELELKIAGGAPSIIGPMEFWF